MLLNRVCNSNSMNSKIEIDLLYCFLFFFPHSESQLLKSQGFFFRCDWLALLQPRRPSVGQLVDLSALIQDFFLIVLLDIICFFPVIFGFLCTYLVKLRWSKLRALTFCPSRPTGSVSVPCHAAHTPSQREKGNK